MTKIDEAQHTCSPLGFIAALKRNGVLKVYFHSYSYLLYFYNFFNVMPPSQYNFINYIVILLMTFILIR
ncbi:unnamed protein product [Trifolium pratense]|uniref:Uncharacterized protein n=2 Tax=Trifolium pratense TaxID=57577 RepID=A0ACB0JQU7_TRIPR|nr:unnamed protein product [Trifolium pratense]CAJ2670570.1 unnamed protein product [Trifolium pratense]